MPRSATAPRLRFLARTPGRRRAAGLASALIVAVVAAMTSALPAAAEPAVPAGTATVRVVIELRTPAASHMITITQRAALRQRAVRANRVGPAARVAPAQANVEASALAAVRTSRENVHDSQNAVMRAAHTDGVDLARATRTSDLLDALYVKVRRSDVARLSALPGVGRVVVDHPVHALDLPADRSVSGTAAGAPAAAPSVDREAGAGKTIAIVDTGIDYTLPDLGAGFGPGHKVLGGYDFVNDDADPMDDHFHGTHVAGIAAGTGVDAITGTAPGANLTAWKVLDSYGVGSSEDVIRGLEAAVDPAGAHPADVVNMSLGETADDADNPVTLAAEAAARTGAVIVAAAGNAGPGADTIGAPAVSPSVLSVGASVTDLRNATARVVGSTRDLPTWRVLWSANAAAQAVTARVIDVGDGTPEDYARVGDVSGAIVSYRGEAPTSTDDYPGSSYAQAILAREKGAMAVLERKASDVPGPGEGGAGPQSQPGIFAAAASDDTRLAKNADSGDLRLDPLVALGINASDYAPIASAVEAGSARVTLTPVDVTDQIASFSSRGPTPRLDQKPDLVAPGVDILSTVPRAQGVPGNTYRLSGTSMAAPAVAGAAAVLRAAQPALSESQVRARLIGSAAPLAGFLRKLPATVQGAGRLDLPAALTDPVTARPASVSLGLPSGLGTAPRRTEVHFTNNGTQAVTARLGFDVGGGSAGKAAVSPSTLQLGPGATGTAVLTTRTPVGRRDTDLSGQIVARISNGRDVHVPFLQSTRTLLVRATPAVATGQTTIAITSPVTLDAPPTLTITRNGTGSKENVETMPLDGSPGWYSVHYTPPAVGTYTISAVGRRGDAVVPGSASFDRAAPTKAGAWQRLGRSGSAGELAVSSVHPGTAVQVAGGSARLFVTSDRGAHWTQVTSLPVSDGIGTPVMDPTDPNAFWYALDAVSLQAPQDRTYQATVLRTTDLGRTWTVLPYPDKHYFAFDGSGNVLVAAVADGLQVSRDGGQSWDLVPFAWGQQPTHVAVTGDRAYVSGYDSIWRIDGLDTSAPATPKLVSSGGNGYMGLDANGDTVAGADFDGTVRISTDSGQSWRQSKLADFDFATGARILGDEVFVPSNSGYWRTKDAGVTWTLTEFPLFGPVSGDVERWPDQPSSLLEPLENAGLYESADDGRTAHRIGVSGMTVNQVATTTDAQGRSVVAIADEQGVGSIVMPAAGPVDENAWGVTGGEGYVGVSAADLAIDASDHTAWTRIHTTGNGQDQLQVSNDSGTDWTTVGPQSFGLKLSGLSLDPTRAGHAVVGFHTILSQGLLVTDDNWATWRVLTHNDASVLDTVIDPAHPSRLWLAAYQGLYRSDDDGQTLTRVDSVPANTVWIDPARPDHLLVGGYTIKMTSDGGKTFHEDVLGGRDRRVSSFAAVTTTLPGATAPQQVLFAGSDDLNPYGWLIPGRGVFRSINGGRSWQSVSGGLQATSVTSLAATPDGKWLVAGTRQGGVHRALISDLVG